MRLAFLWPLPAIAALSVLAVACSSSDESPGGPGTTPPPPPSPVDAGSDTGSPSDAGTDGPVDPNDGFTDAELATMRTLSPLPAVPADPTNAFADNAAAAALGQRLFFDKSYSGALAVASDLGGAGDTGKVACVSCHASAAADDNRSSPNDVSLGTDFGTRNALSLVNASFYKWTNWGGRFDSQWSLPLAVAENAKIMKSTRLQIAHLLWNKYKADYDAIFPVPLDVALDPAAADAARFPASGKPKAAATDPDGAWEGMADADRAIVNRIFANYGKAIAAYMRLYVTRNAPFDKYVAGDKSALLADAKRGFKVFVGKGQCVACHSGTHFSDDDFHDLGVPQTGAHVPAVDLGRFTDLPPLLTSAFNVNGTYSDSTTTGKLTGLAQADTQRATFRTKGLRNVTASAPFMHSGEFATLEAVVQFYSDGGGDPGDAGVKDPKIVPLGLTAGEQADLVAFLKSLDGEAIPSALLVDTSRP
jgi:cytochrome c peroxidase